MRADETYKAFARYYDTYTSSFEADLDLYLALCSPQDRILEVGCGTGRILKRFLQAGFQLTGIDISQEMLEIAEKKLSAFVAAEKLRLLSHDFSCEALPERYDKIFTTWYTFNYILDTPENFLHNLFRSAADRALAIFDLFYPKTLAAPERDDVWSNHEFQDVQEKTIHVKDKRRMLDDIEERTQIYEEDGRVREILTKRRYYSPEQMRKLLEKCGFSQVSFSEKYAADNFREQIRPGKGSSHFIVKARKELKRPFRPACASSPL
ncbi:MAG: methyltransferase domain-containing protein [bacterium]|nr:methyltransferase domain-containing protein [bacterium]